MSRPARAGEGRFTIILSSDTYTSRLPFCSVRTAAAAACAPSLFARFFGEGGVCAWVCGWVLRSPRRPSLRAAQRWISLCLQIARHCNWRNISVAAVCNVGDDPWPGEAIAHGAIVPNAGGSSAALIIHPSPVEFEHKNALAF